MVTVGISVGTKKEGCRSYGPRGVLLSGSGPPPTPLLRYAGQNPLYPSVRQGLTRSWIRATRPTVSFTLLLRNTGLDEVYDE